jgi:para-nitrobenzyl esterase
MLQKKRLPAKQSALKFIGRRDFIGRLSTLAGGAIAAPAIVRALGDRSGLPQKSAAPGSVIAKTRAGKLRGLKSDDGVISFKGIHYAESPAGENRFKPPVKLKSWSGVRDAIDYGPEAIQARGPGRGSSASAPLMDEDCLVLNIWTQGLHDGRKRPVMFYSHGGGFSGGNGGSSASRGASHGVDARDGTALAKNYDVVVVTHNHRLNLLGFLYLEEILGDDYAASGCAGMLDIQEALQWVTDNIESFGGDPHNVMLFGESGGGLKSSTLTAMPSAHGLFQKASIESGSAIYLYPEHDSTETAKIAIARLGLTEKNAHDLVNLPVAAILDVIPDAPSDSNGKPLRPLTFAPVVDGSYIPANPYDPVAPPFSKNVPMIVGTNKDEALAFFRGDKSIFTLDDADLHKRVRDLLYDKADRVIDMYRRTRPNATPTELFSAIRTAQNFWAAAVKMSERKAEQNAAPVYMYQFTYESEVLANDDPPYPLKASHGMEVAFKFDHPDDTTMIGNRPERFQAAANMSHAWASFARNSDPNFDGLPHWPPYTLEKRETMFINAQCQVVSDPNSEERKLWAQL